MPAIRLTAPDGRRWRMKEIAQGKPLGHPSHAMFVHFPAAFYVGALAFDIISRAGHFDEAPIAATWLTIGALAGAVLAAATGLIDWWGMVSGSTKRLWTTRHMIAQLAGASFFVATLILRWPSRQVAHASLVWIALEAAGVVAMLAGNWIGGALVYEMGMRVSTGRKPAAPPSSQPEPSIASSRRG